MNAKRCLVGAAAGLLLLIAPSSAPAKSMYALKLGDSITVQGEIAPTLFAGRACVEVVARTRGDGSKYSETGITELEAGREYWQMASFANADRQDLLDNGPELILRDLKTGESVRTASIGAEYGGGAYTTLNLEFPHPGLWSITLEHNLTRYDYSDGQVVSTASDPAGQALTAAELNALPTPAEPEGCLETATASAGASGDSLIPLVAIGLGVAGVVALALRLRTRALT